MEFSLVASVLLLATLVSVAKCQDTLIQVTIDPLNGTETTSCCLGLVRCKSIDFAFTYCRNDLIMFVLTMSNEPYFLSETVPPFSNRNTLWITTEDTSYVATIVCRERAGVAFVNVTNVNIYYIIFKNCGAFRNSTSRNYSDESNPNALSSFRVGVYFYLCTTVWIEGITVQDSPDAMGVVMYDTTGHITVSQSNFLRNSVPVASNSVQGGGGFYVEFTYCAPGAVCVPSSNISAYKTNANAAYLFSRCAFDDNIASESPNVPFFIPNMANHVAFGRGGGLSLFFNGNSTGNQVQISSCIFHSNTALFGEGYL